ncbi:MAG TPA: PBP1A family penicillin-binding protein [Bacillota bacterium]|jgi:penicillin-binding protein 1A|nr:PBP1A family penicillin-binding protein [Bacillota bacterium]HOL10138.1 PBP1A family penicillin-binding protein [Bacillota bacterium]HPO97866.1 PBP1A family penicillin-binding protein [Bacillota bacterium]
MPSKKRSKKRAKPRRKIPRFFLGLILLAGLVLLCLVFFNPWVWRLDLRGALEQSKVASTVYDREGAAIATLYGKPRLWIKIDQIPVKLREAFIATEDARFYQHKGIDIRGITRALYHDLRTRSKLQGGSTITQQLVKNIFFTNEKDFLRKILEMSYAIRVEQQYSKDQILEFYLNSIYLGHGTWGIAAAAEVYFGKPVTKLSIAEGALIAALAKSPEYYSPFRNYQAGLKRRNLVLKLMWQYGYLTEAEYRDSVNEPLEILDRPGTAYVGAYFVDYVLDVLRAQTSFDENYLRSAGLKIYTTMDREIQKAAEQALLELPEDGADQWGILQPQGALVAINAQNGGLLAIVGGRRYSAAQINRSYKLLRQPGSAIKPFVFAAALEEGYSPDSELSDQPLELEVAGKIWRPQNYDNKYRGLITLRRALEESVNTVAIQLVQNIGIGRVMEQMKRMGITNLVETGTKNDHSLAPLALGGLTKGVNLLELTASYSPFANQGVYSEPFGITRVYDGSGRLIFQAGPRQRQVISPEIAVAMTSIMEGVITRGTGLRARIAEKQAAGKTGTTNRNTNAWFIGYTDTVLAGVWLGNDQAGKPLQAKGVPLGSGTAAAIWGEFLRRVER